jgi:hypothetical protein
VSPGHVVVAFRGTESPTSLDGLKGILLTDAMNLLVVPEGRLGHDLAAAGGLLCGTLIDEAWQGITAEVNSHFLDRYRQLLG